MKTEQILKGIKAADCKADLSAHLDAVEDAITSGECDYQIHEWNRIGDAIQLRTIELDNRVVH